MTSRHTLIVGEQGPALFSTDPFTPEQEARLRAIVREEIDADRLIVGGCNDIDAYARSIAFDRAHILSSQNIDAALAKLRRPTKTENPDQAQPYE
jgi:hypothetical protein